MLTRWRCLIGTFKTSYSSQSFDKIRLQQPSNPLAAARYLIHLAVNTIVVPIPL